MTLVVEPNPEPFRPGGKRVVIRVIIHKDEKRPPFLLEEMHKQLQWAVIDVPKSEQDVIVIEDRRKEKRK